MHLKIGDFIHLSFHVINGETGMVSNQDLANGPPDDNLP